MAKDIFLIKDCTKVVPNRFEFVVLAIARAKDILFGSPVFVKLDKRKELITALEEMCTGKIDIDALRKNIVASKLKRKGANDKMVGLSLAEGQETKSNVKISNIFDLDGDSGAKDSGVKGMFSDQNITPED